MLACRCSPNHVAYTDRRHSQTQEAYAAHDLETMQAARRYGAHVFTLLQPYVGRRVLEVGCGIGTMTSRLLDTSDIVVAIEPNPACVTRTRAAIGAHPRLTIIERHLEECDPSEMRRYGFDTVVCVNVLEHIEDDVAALRSFHDVIAPGGHVLIFVPAVPAAYGPLDAELGHHRRYTRRSLEEVFGESGLDLAVLRYTNPIGLLGWMFNARVTKSTAHSPLQVRLFETLVAPWALPLERLVPPPVGLSLVAVGRRRPAATPP